MIDEYYSKFIVDFKDANASYRYLNFENLTYFVFIDPCCKRYGKKESDIFLHIASFNTKDDEFDSPYSNVYPCVNTEFLNSCDKNCEKKFETLNDGRVVCNFRANSCVYLKQLLIDYKNNKKTVSYWKKDDTFHIRETINNVDYIAIFGMRNWKCKGLPVLYLITMFPIVFKSFKRKYNLEEEKYKK